jgi:hypothetical protein
MGVKMIPGGAEQINLPAVKLNSEPCGEVVKTTNPWSSTHRDSNSTEGA